MVLSISGCSVEHYQQTLEIVNNDSRIHAVELNLSCPNVGTGLAFSSDPQLLRQTVTTARASTKLPLFIKLSPNVTDIRVSAVTCQDCGADAITLSNTFHAMTIDIKKHKPTLGNISGGMSGPAIKPLNMYLVWRASEAADIPIIACGGITCWQDVVEYIMAGATMVQVGCSNFTKPLCMQEVITGLDRFMAENGFCCLADMRGIAHQK